MSLPSRDLTVAVLLIREGNTPRKFILTEEFWKKQGTEAMWISVSHCQGSACPQ